MGVYIGPEGARKGQIIIVQKEIEQNPDHEIIERKGLGHPDTICDALAVKLSQNYARYTVENCDGMILHHQFDKVMIIGGKTDVTWGHGEFLEPVLVNIAGRISRSYLDRQIPTDEIVQETVKSYFAENFSLFDLDADLKINNFLTSSAGPGTIRESRGAIKNMFNPVDKGAVRGYEELVANDTSYCIGYAPLSRLENAVLETERYLNSKSLKEKYLWLGSDIKIMAVKHKEAVDMTICIPQIAKYVHSLEEYQSNLEIASQEVMNMLSQYFSPANINLSVNTKDDYEKCNVYLTVTGASLSGDIGVVGRGNRPNGLITANRPMSIEGTCGKNPRYYSGFIYAVASRKIADRVCSETQKPCVVEIVSQNGGDLLQPWKTFVITGFNDEGLIKELVRQEFQKIPKITEEFLKGSIITY